MKKGNWLQTIKCRGLVAVLLVCAMVLGGCSQGQTNQTTVVDDEVVKDNAVNSAADENALPEVDKSIYMDPSQDVEIRIKALLEQMTLEEKAGQMVQAEQAQLNAADVLNYGIGSVLSGGGSAPSFGNNPDDWNSRVTALKQAALNSRLGIPLLYGVDAVHGHNNVFGATVFPHNIALGAANDLELVEQIGRATAEEVRGTGIQWDFAPTLGNAQDERWGRTYECFSEKYDDVTMMGAAYIRGFQGAVGTEEYLDETHVLACAKHYIGEGYAKDGVNQGNIDMTPEEFDALLQSGVINPYTQALDEGVRTVMVTYNSMNGLKCTENKHLIQEILKDQLGFTGLVVSDYNAVQQLSGSHYKEQVRLALDAGIDLFMEPQTWKDCRNCIVSLVEDGEITMERVDDAVSRILRVKFEAGLFEEVINSETEMDLLANIGSEEHRAIARQAVRESLVLLKNDMVGEVDALTALNNAMNVQVSGSKAADIGAQCGGWTISWQGLLGQITTGTPIIQGFAEATQERGVTITYDVEGTLGENTEAIVVVVGEGPYAEMEGDRTFESLKIQVTDIEMLTGLKTALDESGKDIPVVAVILAGRPLDLREYDELFDAVVMAWLPGTEGAGVADVLFGEYDFTGTLSFTWMADPVDIPLKMDAALNGTEIDSEKILYPYGYGLNKAGEKLVR